MNTVFRAIADPSRRKVLDHLACQGEPVKELAREFGVSFPAVPQHLKALQRAKLITCHCVGRQIRYRLDPASLHDVKKRPRTGSPIKQHHGMGGRNALTF
jgi:DNA-binding transcriptional ArsR family regulator